MMNGAVSAAVQNLDARLGGVQYRLANNPGDFRAAHELMRAEGFEPVKMAFPTVLATEDGEVVGIFTTNPRRDVILAGPMVLKSDRPRRFTALRLMEAYDSLMRQAGVSTYMTWVNAGEDNALQVLSKLPQTEVLQQTADGTLFARRL